jgi:hypothetical protein
MTGRILTGLFFGSFWWWSTSGNHPKKYLASKEIIENTAENLRTLNLNLRLKSKNLFTYGELFLEV